MDAWATYATYESRVLWQSSQRFLPLPDEVERPRNASKEEWLSRSRSAAPLRHHLTGLGSQLEKRASSCRGDVLQIQRQYVCRMLACITNSRTRVRTLLYGEADKPGEPTRRRCFTRYLSSAGCTSPRSFRFLRESPTFTSETVFISEQN